MEARGSWSYPFVGLDSTHKRILSLGSSREAKTTPTHLLLTPSSSLRVYTRAGKSLSRSPRSAWLSRLSAVSGRRCYFDASRITGQEKRLPSSCLRPNGLHTMHLLTNAIQGWKKKNKNKIEQPNRPLESEVSQKTNEKESEEKGERYLGTVWRRFLVIFQYRLSQGPSLFLLQPNLFYPEFLSTCLSLSLSLSTVVVTLSCWESKISYSDVSLQ